MSDIATTKKGAEGSFTTPEATTAAATIAAEDKRFNVTDIIVPKADHYLAIVTFCLLGMTQLLLWNMIMSCGNTLNGTVWPDTVFLDLLGGTEHAAALLISIVMIKLNGLSIWGCMFWTFVNCGLNVVFPLIPQTLHGNEHYSAAVGLLTAVCAGLGLCAGMMHVYGYAFASILPSNYVGWVSTGNGLAGAYAFLVYLLLSEAIFEKSLYPQLSMLWVYFITGAAIGVVQLVCFWLLSRKEWFQQCIELAKNKHHSDMEATLKEWGPRRSIAAIFKDCWGQAMNSSFTLFVTLFVFPVCGPLGWGKGFTNTTLLIGTFQMVDLLTRWLPTLGGWTYIPKKYLWICVLLRPVVFVPLFLVASRLQDAPFFSSLPWLFIVMVIFTTTNGWFVTLGAVYCPECVEHPAETEIAAEIFVIMLLGMLTLGIYASKLTVL